MKGHKEDGIFHPHRNHESAIHASDINQNKIKTKKPKFIKATKETKDNLHFRKLAENNNAKLVGEFNIKPSLFTKLTDNEPKWIPDHGKGSVKILKERIENQKPVDQPLLEIETKPDPELYSKQAVKRGIIEQHEGRHRAYVARKLGIEEIPVGIYSKKHGILDRKYKKITKETLAKTVPQDLNRKDYDKLVKAVGTKKQIQNWKERDKKDEKIRQGMEQIFN